MSAGTEFSKGDVITVLCGTPDCPCKGLCPERGREERIKIDYWHMRELLSGTTGVIEETGDALVGISDWSPPQEKVNYAFNTRCIRKHVEPEPDMPYSFYGERE